MAEVKPEEQEFRTESGGIADAYLSDLKTLEEKYPERDAATFLWLAINCLVAERGRTIIPFPDSWKK